MSLLCFHLQVYWLLIAVPTAFGVIILTPQNDSIAPYNSDEIVTYDCEIDSDQELLWTIDNLNVQLQRIDQKERYADRYGIKVEDQLPRLNKTRLNFNVTQFSQSSFRQEHGSELVIGCQPFAKIAPNFPNHTIFVYGPLDTPSNVEFSAFSETHLKLSWTGTRVPHSVQVINHVQVTNLSSGVTEQFNTTEGFITFDETGVCSEFNLTVMSSNEQVGDSGVGFTLQNIPISPDVSPVFESLATRVELEDTISITIMFRPANVCSTDFPVENYTVILRNSKLPILNFGQEQIVTVINDTVISGLSMDQSFRYFIEACSNVTCRTTGTSTAYTTGIQAPTVYFIEGSRHVLVTCDFASGSRASGCLLNFTITSGVVDSELYNFSRDSKENSSLCDGGSQACMCISTKRFVTSYSTIEAYTLEEDGVTRSRISVPTARRKVTENPERISVCNPSSPTTQPLDPGNNDSLGRVIGGVVGGVVGGGLVLVGLLLVTIVICIVRVRRVQKKEHANTATELTRQPKEICLEVEVGRTQSDFTTQKIPERDGDSDSSEDNLLRKDPEQLGTLEIKVRARVEKIAKDGASFLKVYYNESQFKEEAKRLLDDSTTHDREMR